MKTIGIRLADGTFYPILEEGIPKRRMLDLTTAKDNQTKVQIDLYRSETGTIEDAEYVDTLEVTKLNPHPNGEPDLHLSVELDENNHLSAEVIDQETGKKSETEVSLVSRTLAERASPSDFSVSNAEEAHFSSDELPEIKSDALEDMPFHFAASDLNRGAEIDSMPFDGAMPDFSDSDTEIPVADSTLESVDFSKDRELEHDTEKMSDSQNSTVSEPDTHSGQNDTIVPEEFSLPDFDTIETDTTHVEPDATDDFTATDFSIPDFDMPDSSSTEDDSTAATGLDFSDLDDPSFTSDTFESDFDSLNFEDEKNQSSSEKKSVMDFSDLYDKETIAGEHASLYDEDEAKKKTRLPVIICIVCAIICVIATILVLFIVPSKYNLIKSRNTRSVKTEEVAELEPAAEESMVEEPNPVAELPAADELIVVTEEPAPAVEDKIVIAETPEEIVPVPEAKPEKKPDVTYHIKWGDTLWDISESYYKNPWKYPRISDYNKIRNPDLIISGTDILIPAE